MPKNCKNNLEYVVDKRCGWFSIVIPIMKFYTKHFFKVIGIDVLLYLLYGRFAGFFFVVLFWSILVTNHEYGHYAAAKKITRNNYPIILLITKNKKYIVYSIENCSDYDIVKVRSNAIKYDLFSVLIGTGVYITDLFFFTRIVILLVAILNFANYLIWTKGSDGYVIKEYIKCNGVKKFMEIFFFR